MPEPFWLALALLPVAAWSGWWAATRAYRRGERRQQHAISSNYFKGLNYLLNEQPDKAIEVFLKLAEINTETVKRTWRLATCSVAAAKSTRPSAFTGTSSAART